MWIQLRPYRTGWDVDSKWDLTRLIGMWLQQRPYRTGWDVDPTETFQENSLEPLQDWLEWLLLPHAHILS